CAFLDRQIAYESEPRELLGERTPGGSLNDQERVAESALLLGTRQHGVVALGCWAAQQRLRSVGTEQNCWSAPHRSAEQFCLTSGNARLFEWGIRAAQTLQLRWLGAC